MRERERERDREIEREKEKEIEREIESMKEREGGRWDYRIIFVCNLLNEMKWSERVFIISTKHAPRLCYAAMHNVLSIAQIILGGLKLSLRFSLKV